MKFEESVADQIALLNAGRILEALDRYFAEDGIMWDNEELFAEGLAESRSKQERFINNAQAIHGKNHTLRRQLLRPNVCISESIEFR